MKLTKAKFKAMRTAAYKLAGELGTLAELYGAGDQYRAYDHASKAIDHIDDMGVRLGFLNPETLEYV